MPRSFRALLPTEIRTAHGPRSAEADALMGSFRLSRAVPARHAPGFPGTSLLRFSHPGCGSRKGRRSRDLAHARAGFSLAGSAGSLEVFHQDLSSVLPMTVASCRINPTGSEWARAAGLHGVNRRRPTTRRPPDGTP
jgi:hypothetical protein